MITGIGHLAFRVADMDASIDFYCSKLGFTDAFELKNDKGQPWIRYIKVAQGQFIELFYGGSGSTDEGSYAHLCLLVDDIELTAGQLVQRGVVLDRPVSRGKDGNRQCWVRDPDGNRIEFIQIASDSLQSKS